MSFQKITESDSLYRHLEKMTVAEIMENMNREDRTVALRVGEAIPALAAMADAIVDKLLSGGRLIYIGAGTSGRLGVLDAAECPPTFGVEPDLVNGIIAGGKKALVAAVEGAEDDADQGWKDLQEITVNDRDFVLGLAASGSTPYVIGALRDCRRQGIPTGSISCNPGSPVSAVADHPVEIVVGPELVTGSTRLKAGTAQKMALNMISTSVMIRLGRVEDNKMVHMQLTNEKLRDRGVRIIMEARGLSAPEAAELLERYRSVREALKS